MKKLLILSCAALALAGCTRTNLFNNPTSAATTLYQVESDYAVVLGLAVQYRKLPVCGSGGVLCSNPAVLVKIRAANAAVVASLNTAQSVVRAKGTAAQIEAAVSNAENNIAALQALLPTGAK